jgi:2-polyprenyl-3-methyl-5-hydroxy-6-metoxy-1,4-benzoquinol methylase
MSDISISAISQHTTHLRMIAKSITRRTIRPVDRLIRQRDDLLQERTGLVRQRDDLLQERTGLLRQRDDLLQERTGLLRQRDDFLREKTCLLKRHDDLISEIESSKRFAVGRFRIENDCEIEVDATSDQLSAMLARIAAEFSSLGEMEPYWSVVTHDDYLRQNIEQNLNAFYASGESTVVGTLACLARNQIDVAGIRRALDYGCGVGRLTVPLAERFPTVTGIDVSESHIAHARRYAADRQVENVDFVQLTELEQLDSLTGIDFILSFIVLQHNPPPVIAFILRKLLKALNPGGCILFQVPTYIHGYWFSCADYLSSAPPQIEMNPIAQRVVFALARECECNILEVREDGWTGSALMLSHSFLMQKAY